MNKYYESKLKSFNEWKLELAEDVELTSELEANIGYLLSNITPGIGFALIGNNSAVAFEIEEYMDYEEVEKFVEDAIRNTMCCYPPDFSKYDFPDGGMFVLMGEGRLWHFMRPEDCTCEDSFSNAYQGRVQLQMDAEEGEILGILREYKYVK